MNPGSANITTSDICILGILPRPPILCPPGQPCIPLSWSYNGQFCLENETPLEWRPQSLLCTNTQIWYDTTQSDNLRSNVKLSQGRDSKDAKNIVDNRKNQEWSLLQFWDTTGLAGFQRKFHPIIDHNPELQRKTGKTISKAKMMSPPVLEY